MQETAMLNENQNQNAGEDKELKAYIYQQLAELQPYLVADSQMAVSVHQVAAIDHVDPEQLEEEERENLEDLLDEEENHDRIQPEVGDYVVKLTTTLEGGRLVAQGHGADVFEAFGVAKGSMVNQLSQLQNALMDSSERAQEIENYMNGSKTIH